MKECVHGDANLLMSGDVVGAEDGRFFEWIATWLRGLYVSISDRYMNPNDYVPIGYSLSIRLDRVDHDECIFTMKDEQNNELTFNGDSGIVSATLAMTFAALAVKMATQSELSSIDVRMGKDNKYKWTKEVVTFQEVAMQKGWRIDAVDDYYKLQIAIASRIQQMSYPHLVSMMAELYKTVDKNNSDLKAKMEKLLDKYPNVKDGEVEKSRNELVAKLKQLLKEQYTTHKTDVQLDNSEFVKKLEELTELTKGQTMKVEAIQKSVSNGKKSVQSLSAQLANANTLISDLVEKLANANGTIDEAFKRASDNLNTKNNIEFTSALNDLKTTIDTALKTEKATLQETAKALNHSLSTVRSDISEDIDRLTRGMNSATENMSDILLNQFKESLNGLLSQMETPSNRDVLVEASGSQSQGVAMGFIKDVLLSGAMPPGIQANALFVSQSTPEPLLNGGIQELLYALESGTMTQELLAKVQKNAIPSGLGEVTDSGAAEPAAAEADGGEHEDGTEITTHVVATETNAEVERTYGSTSSVRIVFFATLLAAYMLWLLSHRRVGQETLQPFDNGKDNWLMNAFYPWAFPGINTAAAQVQPQRPDDIRVGSCEKKEEKRTAQA